MSDFDPWKPPSEPSPPPQQPSWQPPPAWEPPAHGGSQPWGAPPVQQTNGLAIASLVCGILVFFCFFTWIPAIVCGHIARKQIKTSGGLQSGNEIAVIGLVLGYIGLGFTLLSILFLMLALVLAVPPMQMLR